MPAGPISAYQPLDSKPLMVSATVGTRGNEVVRFAPQVAMARSRPLCINGSAASVVLT